jgi:hypothetical protein
MMDARTYACRVILKRFIFKHQTRRETRHLPDNRRLAALDDGFTVSSQNE